MAKHFHKELERLKKRILSLGAMVEKRVRMAIKAIETRDTVIASEIIKQDYEIDEVEVEIEHLPAASGDSAMMRQVFANLLSNAIKFSGAKQPARIKD